MSTLLKFGKGNAKLKKGEFTFSLPSGFTCPAANECLSKAARDSGKIADGPFTKYRCFAASAESRSPALRNAVWHNFDLLKAAKTRKKMADLITESLKSLPKTAKVVRVHVGGDYYNEAYFLAWRDAAKNFPHIQFYSYTKRADLLVKHGQVDGNFRVVASVGGKHDKLVDKHKLISARVVYSHAEADSLGLEIDHDDSHAIECKKSFALLIHGTQPAGSAASKAVSALRKAGWSGYSS